MKNLIIASIALLSVNSFAAQTNVLNTEYQTINVKASQVEGVKVYIEQEYERHDCNQVTLDAKETVVDGNKTRDGEVINYYTTYFVSVSAWATEAFCPLETPVTETIRSQAIDLKSFTNPNVNGEIEVNIILPKGYDLKVEEY